MKIFQLIDLIIRLFRLNKKSKVVLLFLIPTFLVGQNNAAFWLGKRPSGAAPTNLLLDDYPGAAAAYSVRKLDKDYTGFAMEIRRASDNATQNIGFVGENLDVTSINTFCTGTTCTVRTWYDQSGNGRDAIQTIVANQPLIYASGSVRTTGTKPSIYATVDDVLKNSSITKTSENTLIAAYQHYQSPTNVYNFVIDLNRDRAYSFQSVFAYNVASNTGNYSASINPFVYQITSIFFKSASSFYVNGVLAGSGSLTVTPGSGILYLGSRAELGSTLQSSNDYQEIIYYATDIGNTNRAAIENNINSYYSIY